MKRKLKFKTNNRRDFIEMPDKGAGDIEADVASVSSSGSGFEHTLTEEETTETQSWPEHMPNWRGIAIIERTKDNNTPDDGHCFGIGWEVRQQMYWGKGRSLEGQLTAFVAESLTLIPTTTPIQTSSGTQSLLPSSLAGIK